MHKLLIVSDSHGLTDELQMIKNRHNISTMIHCGDSELTNNHPIIKSFTTVQGNCDEPAQFNDDEQFSMNGLKFYVTHGHLFRVKHTLLPLTYRANEVNANILCFGHSHIAGAEKIDKRIYINPGSIRYPRRIRHKTYVVMSWENHYKIHVQFLNLDGQVLEHLSKTFHLD